MCCRIVLLHGSTCGASHGRSSGCVLHSSWRATLRRQSSETAAPATSAPAAIAQQRTICNRAKLHVHHCKLRGAAVSVRAFGMGCSAIISWFDDKMGRLLDQLEATGQLHNTIIVYVSDHGEMAGEHGMWRKSNMYEASARVPLQIAWPGASGTIAPGVRIGGVCSTVDLIATLLDLCHIGGAGLPPLDGDSLAPLLSSSGAAAAAAAEWKDEAVCEYLAHGCISPNAMLRAGRCVMQPSTAFPLPPQCLPGHHFEKRHHAPWKVEAGVLPRRPTGAVRPGDRCGRAARLRCGAASDGRAAACTAAVSVGRRCTDRGGSAGEPAGASGHCGCGTAVTAIYDCSSCCSIVIVVNPLREERG